MQVNAIPKSSISLLAGDVEDENTIVILGSPRGGTSMIAGICRQLGVMMGEEIHADNNEDAEFTSHKGDRALLKQDPSDPGRAALIEHLRGLVDSRNEEYPAWGWKDPLSTYYVPDLLDKLRNPRFICIARDFTAVTTREIVQNSMDPATNVNRLLTHLSQSLEQFNAMVALARQTKRPFLFISYERAVRYPKETLSEIARFIGKGMPAKVEDYDRLLAYIAPERHTGDINRVIRPRNPEDGGGGDTVLSDAAADAFALKVQDAVDALGSLPYFSRETSRVCARKADLAMGSGQFELAEQECLRALAAAAFQIPELVRHPSVLTQPVLTRVAAQMPPVISPIWFRLGMRNLQKNGDPALAYAYFKAILTLYEVDKRFYLGEQKPALFWSTLFHQGFAAMVVGNRAEARMTMLRLLMGHQNGFPLDEQAFNREEQEFAIYSERAEEMLTKLRDQ